MVLKDCVTETKVTLCAVEHLDQPGKVHQRAGQPIDLVDDDDVDLPRLDVGQQALQGGPLQRAAREAAVVVAVGHQKPALGLLAGDIGLAGLALGVERVELLLEAFLGRLAGIDRAAKLGLEDDRRVLSRSSPLVLEAEENQAVPSRAGDGAGDRRERLYGRPWYSKSSSRTVTACSIPLHSRISRVPVIGRSSGRPRRRLRLPPSICSPSAISRALTSGFKPAEGQLLNPIGQSAFEEAPVVRRRLRSRTVRATSP